MNIKGLVRGAGLLGSGAAVSAVVLLSQGAGASQYQTGTCEWNNPQATVLCVHRAPHNVCVAALNNTRQPCWWWTGSDSQIVFNWRGRVVQS
jgi:hypothetical protein